MHSCILLVADTPENLILVQNNPQPQVIELNGMVEGVACRFEFLVRNETDHEIRDLSTRVSCGCLRAAELEGLSLPSKGQVAFKLTVLPTAVHYGQTLTLGGIGADGVRREIAVVRFKGEVTPPLEVTPQTISVSDLNQGPVRLRVIAPAKGIHFDLQKATLVDDRFQLQSLDSSEIAVSANSATIVPHTLLVQVPFRIQEAEFQHTLRIEVADNSLKVSPSAIVLTERNGYFTGRFIVQSKVDKILNNLNLRVESRDGSANGTSLDVAWDERNARQAQIVGFKILIEKDQLQFV